jgi:hypothetical protein
MNSQNLNQRRSVRRGSGTNAGFTVSELLVGVLLSSIVIIGIYGASQNSARTFQIQTDAAETIDQLNFAMDIVKGDLRRAAYLSVPNGQVSAYPSGINVCGVPVGTVIQALQLTDADNDWEPPQTENGPTAIMMVNGSARVPDQLTLLGAYRTDRSFPVVLSQPNQLRAQHQLEGGTALQEAEVNGIISPMFDRAILAVYSRSDAVQFIRMTTGSTATAVSGATDTIQIPIQDAVQDYVNEVCDFGSPWAQGRRVVPLHRVRFSLQRDVDNPSQTVFVREELGADDTVLDRIVVANNIIDFQVWFDQRGGEIGQPMQSMVSDGTQGDDEGGVPETQLNGTATARPELARYAYIQMSARLQNPIRGLEFEGSGFTSGLREVVEVVDFDPATSEDVPTDTYTRVVTVRAEVDLTNFMLAD